MIMNAPSQPLNIDEHRVLEHLLVFDDMFEPHPQNPFSFSSSRNPLLSIERFPTSIWLHALNSKEVESDHFILAAIAIADVVSKARPRSLQQSLLLAPLPRRPS